MLLLVVVCFTSMVVLSAAHQLAFTSLVALRGRHGPHPHDNRQRRRHLSHRDALQPRLSAALKEPPARPVASRPRVDTTEGGGGRRPFDGVRLEWLPLAEARKVLLQSNEGVSLRDLSRISVTRLKGISSKRQMVLAEANVHSISDLLLFFPRRYVDREDVSSIKTLLPSRRRPSTPKERAADDAALEREVTVCGEIASMSHFKARTGTRITKVVVKDEAGGRLSAVWFNQEFRAAQLRKGMVVALGGKVERRKGGLEMRTPDVQVIFDPFNAPPPSSDPSAPPPVPPGTTIQALSAAINQPSDDNDDASPATGFTGRVVPLYGGVGGIPPKILLSVMQQALEAFPVVREALPQRLIEERKLIGRGEAVRRLHFPQSVEEVPEARRRLYYDSLLRMQLAVLHRREAISRRWPGVANTGGDGSMMRRFLESLPFNLTNAQRRVLDEVTTDMAADHPMHRLLQGDVGAGKTVVAVGALLQAVGSGRQGAVLAPTENLAGQHYLTLRRLCAPMGIRIELLTSDSPDRQDTIEGLKTGLVDIVVGTHALLEDTVHYYKLGLVVVDEQHRFGVNQRVVLRVKGQLAGGCTPDVLLMTATPIPRTQVMTQYGDLLESRLDEMPPGRREVATEVIDKADNHTMASVYERLRQEVSEGRQGYWVCPLVNVSERIEARAAIEEHARLQQLLPEIRFGLMHGQMRPSHKEAVMEEFRQRRVDILVATTVIEVGIDIPSASIMVVDDAHRFGLCQLHQLRGRVGRSTDPASCLLLTQFTDQDGAENLTVKARRRFAVMCATYDGFVLAEEDLTIRGEGTVFGTAQHGESDLRPPPGVDPPEERELLHMAYQDARRIMGGEFGVEGQEVVEEARDLIDRRKADWLLKA